MTAFAEAAGRLAQALGGGPAADLAAAALIEADALGQTRFGIAMLDEWTPDCAAPPTVGPSGVVSWRDCSASFAPLAVASATLDLAASAREHGMAAVFLRGIRGFGRQAPFVRHLADAGLVGLACAEGPPFVAPHGGSAPVIGTNPLALAMGTGGAQVVIDAASSSTTMAALRAARAAGTALPDGTALDGEGRLTRNAAEVAALLPRGGQIGSLLGLMVELLAGVLGGGRGDPRGRGVVLLAIDPSAAGTGIDWQASLAALRRDWIAGGGYWPRGASMVDGSRLDAGFAQRLDAQLARMAARVAP